LHGRCAVCRGGARVQRRREQAAAAARAVACVVACAPCARIRHLSRYRLPGDVPVWRLAWAACGKRASCECKGCAVGGPGPNPRSESNSTRAAGTAPEPPEPRPLPAPTHRPVSPLCRSLAAKDRSSPERSPAQLKHRDACRRARDRPRGPPSAALPRSEAAGAPPVARCRRGAPRLAPATRPAAERHCGAAALRVGERGQSELNATAREPLLACARLTARARATVGDLGADSSGSWKGLQTARP
jgi:hypothetical protein